MVYIVKAADDLLSKGRWHKRAEHPRGDVSEDGGVAGWPRDDLEGRGVGHCSYIRTGLLGGGDSLKIYRR
jgi:hypothetical protein